MDFLKKFFPFSFKFETTQQFVKTIILYVVFAFVAGLILGFMGLIPYIGILFRILVYPVDLYFTGGVVIAILRKVGVIKA